MTTARNGSTLIYTALVVAYGVAILFPVFWMATMTVKPEQIMFERPTVWFFMPTLDHFSYVLEQGFHWSLISSLVVAGLSTLLVVVIGTPAAYAFARFQMWRRDDLFLFVLATRMAPPMCLVIPFYLIYAKIGLIERPSFVSRARFTSPVPPSPIHLADTRQEGRGRYGFGTEVNLPHTKSPSDPETLWRRWMECKSQCHRRFATPPVLPC